jgi:hypothetical protein
MTKPLYTWRPAAEGNYRSGRTAAITQITFHHIVGDAAAAIARFQTPGEEVSATYVIGSDGTLYQTVREEDTPYTDGNYDSNCRSITIEHAGGHPSVPYTDAMYATSTQLVRYLLGKYDIQRLARHRDVSDQPTECPGGLDVERIIKGAQENDMLTREQIQVTYRLVTLGEEANEDHLTAWIGKDLNDYLQYLEKDPSIQGLQNGYKEAAEGNIVPLSSLIDKLYIKEDLK